MVDRREDDLRGPLGSTTLQTSEAAAEPRSGAETTDAQARFEALITGHLDRLYRTALRLTRERTRAEDLVQDVMYKAWRSFRTFQEGTSARAWLHKILMNTYFDVYRKRTREPEVVDVDDVGEFYLYDKVAARSDLAQSGNPEFHLLDQMMDTEVRESLERLPPPFRAAVILADLEGFSYKEMAEILGVPVGTVMSRLSRGRHLLQKRLWDYARERHYIKGRDMNCAQVVEHLWPFLDGELDVATSDELKQHLDECRRCFSRAEFERRLRTMVRRSCEGESAPAPLQERVRRLIRSF